MKVVYISGPYSNKDIGKQRLNITKALVVAEKYWKLGYAVICPHTNSAWMDEVVPYEQFMEGDLEILKRCDIIVMMEQWNKSKGASKEREFAYKLKKKILYE
jgi:hypothetical protein